MLTYDALETTAISDLPFRHVTVANFVPRAVLGDVVSGLPALRSGGSFPVEGLRLGPAARRLMTELAGPRFRAAISHKFSLDLADAPTMITLRGWSREKDGRIHRDSEAKLATILLYLSPDTAAWSRQEGCLRLLRGPSDLEDYAEEVPPTNGTLLVFPNGPATWHGHRQFVGPRYVVQLNYMANSAAARHEMRRHRLSAFIKRLLRAA